MSHLVLAVTELIKDPQGFALVLMILFIVVLVIIILTLFVHSNGQIKSIHITGALMNVKCSWRSTSIEGVFPPEHFSTCRGKLVEKNEKA